MSSLLHKLCKTMMQCESDRFTIKKESEKSSLEQESISLFIEVCQYLDEKSICQLSQICTILHKCASAESIWKPKCLERWSELQHATSLLKDPFPIWKTCFGKKQKEKTTMQSLKEMFGNCDWYTCPNGHLYVIGECRIPVELGKCPECGSNIGGKYHRMLDTNTHVGAVRGSFNIFHSSGQSIYDEEKVDFLSVQNLLTNRHNSHDMKESNTITQKDTETMFQHNGLTPPDYLICPLSQDIFQTAVVTPQGRVYEKNMIETWLCDHDTDPIDTSCRLKLQDLKPEPQIQEAVELWHKRSRS
ncbi:hypothetical protein RFI_25276 [Reticulomyxa filosa]|uniref:Uncharacterized protein n=1 Tax=Reticulomyxa filosa TaxID=46433 RepID=X6MEK1_RETFI|nr:hypothetical protein RFI_25276 [Reticulomyxa filosa]|eukprot:ETO12101.1 hypothetical protein RFI_25276 [Reticulomyxa filosa]